MCSALCGVAFYLFGIVNIVTERLLESEFDLIFECLSFVVTFGPAESLANGDGNLVWLHPDLGNTRQVHEFCNQNRALDTDFVEIRLA